MPIPADAGQPQTDKTKKSFSIMRVAISVVIFVIVAGGAVVSVSVYKKYYEPIRCGFSGGSWREYSSRQSCKKDYCSAIGNNDLCRDVLWEKVTEESKSYYMGCDCGQNKCWDGESRKCVGNPK